jgi:uncharacterized membrane protein YeiB
MTAPDSSTASAATAVPTISSPSPFSSASSQEHTLAVAPVRLDERISALDTIRGFGLLGILLMNICAFGLPLSAYANPVPAGGATGLNLFTWCFMNVAPDGKMRGIFSMAFGASVYLLIDRLSAKALPPTPRTFITVACCGSCCSARCTPI